MLDRLPHDAPRRVVKDFANLDELLDQVPEPAAAEITSQMNEHTRQEMFTSVDDTIDKLEVAIASLVANQASNQESNKAYLQQYVDRLQRLQQKLQGLPNWEPDDELFFQQQASTQSQLVATVQQATAAAEAISHNVPVAEFDADVPPVPAPDEVAPKTGRWNTEYLRSQGIETKEPAAEPVASEVETIAESPSEEAGEAFDFSTLEQRYHAVIDDPFVVMTDEERMTLQSAFANYQRIAGDVNKSEAVKEQAAANVATFLEQATPEPTDPVEVADKMQHLQTFLKEKATIPLSPTDQETVKALREMYEAVTPKDGESEAEYVARLSKQYQLMEDVVRGFYEDGKLTTDRPLVLTDPIAVATDESLDAADSAVESGGLSAQEELEADFTTAVQRHIHNLRLLLEAEGRGSMFTSAASSGPLKKSDITRWLEVSEKKYNALREKLNESGATDMTAWADEHIAPLEVKLGWRKKPSLYSKLSKRLFRK